MTNSTPGTVVLTATERVHFGQPAAQALAAEAETIGAERVMLIASTSLADKTDEIAKIEQALGSRHATTFTGVQPHGPRTDVVAATEKAREVGADLIVSVGGGSATDCAKIVPICLSNDVHSTDDMEPLHVYVDDAGGMVLPSFKPQTVRTICVPTTLSGGEFNPLSGATDPATKAKQAYTDRMMAPVSVILDPALTRHTPDWLWFSTGVRALDHAIETLQSFQSNDYCDGLAESALRLLIEGLPRVKADPEDLEARMKCQIGVWQSMLPIIGGVPMGASHAIGHVLGGLCDVPHGYTSCVMSPFVLRWNASVNATRQARISAAFEAPDQPAADLVDAFITNLGMPRSLSAVDVGEGRLQKIAEYTMDDIWGRTNPRPISQPSDVMQILELAR
ncbi:iron-containing alcohol dehydrogenase [Phaeobacter gallaeciensis]|jgi:alcohol dehydrogenase class IV|uniref:iron-containing alcohol dehydrogenase n=1 Tax=Phaeobacter gallaeciensis TaxID=60890 RepID=UPI00237FE1B8|nr:iron-containing alcohol dehydrogenase [Phaeobacter gallaeciensis]MDE4276782.1 iron-containing alcohol dehydrogenase [Phaeobacter gallaeciensis]MDE4302016.1 iron-containing alcohol dehydrogenase [Phaeobacter gallaeciensis]MDE5187206.1 iron-containing alcohol dehydrogenase [Phaeobacter gallaeciensis]